MTINPSAIKSNVKWMLACILMLVCAVIAKAQAVNGTVTGRVLNVAINEYIRNAEVYLAGTDRMVLTEEGGFFVIAGVPAGTAKIEVRYMGLATQTKTVEVAAGKRVNVDFDMRDIDAPKGSDVLVLETFTVLGEREGNAKALQAQKNSMNFTNVIATDTFGDIAEGNVGEFLKYLPGLAMDYVESETRYLSIGGMDAKYASVTIDGAGMASAGSSNFGGDSRSFSFEQASINSIETIEVNKTNSADMDGDAPAGNVNLKIKSAFDRKGRFVSYSLYVTANSYYPNYSRSAGPRDEYMRKTKPGFSLAYSEAFLKNRLGISMNYSQGSSYKAQNRLTHYFSGWQSTTPAEDTPAIPSQPYINRITYKDGPVITSREALGVKFDYKISPMSKASIGYSWSTMAADTHNRTLDFRTSGQSSSNSSLTQVTSNASGYVNASGQSFTKSGAVNSIIANFESRFGRFKFDTMGAYSHSKNRYEDMSSTAPYARNIVYRAPSIAWVAERPDAKSTEWTITQTNVNAAGTNNMTDFSTWTNNNTNGWIESQSRHSSQDKFEGNFNLRWDAPTAKTLYFKTGAKIKHTKWNVWDATNSANSSITDTWRFVDPDFVGANDVPVTNKLSPSYASPFHFDGDKGGNLYALNMPYVSRGAVYQTFVEHPDYFTLITTGNALRRELGAEKDLLETVYAGYFMGFYRPHPRVDIQAGLRYESTDQESNMVMPLTKIRMRALGWGDASSENPEYVRTEYNNGERTKKTNDYSFWLPSVSVKYKWTPNLQTLWGYNETYGRVDVNKIAGGWAVNNTEGDLWARLPNPYLKADHFKAYVARLEYYFEPAGSFSIGYTHRHWNGISYDETTIEPGSLDDLMIREIYGDDQIDMLRDDGYEIRSYTDSTASPRNIQTFEFEYRQQLPFFKQVSISANYTYVIPSWEKTFKTAPKSVGFGTSYGYGGFKINLKGTWADRMLTDGSNQYYKYARLMFDVDVSYRITKILNIYASVRNLTNERQAWYKESPDYLYQHEQYGANITVGIRGTF
jgi:TonB-dependent receptor